MTLAEQHQRQLTELSPHRRLDYAFRSAPQALADGDLWSAAFLYDLSAQGAALGGPRRSLWAALCWERLGEWERARLSCRAAVTGDHGLSNTEREQAVLRLAYACWWCGLPGEAREWLNGPALQQASSGVRFEAAAIFDLAAWDPPAPITRLAEHSLTLYLSRPDLANALATECVRRIQAGERCSAPGLIEELRARGLVLDNSLRGHVLLRADREGDSAAVHEAAAWLAGTPLELLANAVASRHTPHDVRDDACETALNQLLLRRSSLGTPSDRALWSRAALRLADDVLLSLARTERPVDAVRLVETLRVSVSSKRRLLRLNDDIAAPSMSDPAALLGRLPGRPVWVSYFDSGGSLWCAAQWAGGAILRRLDRGKVAALVATYERALPLQLGDEAAEAWRTRTKASVEDGFWGEVEPGLALELGSALVPVEVSDLLDRGQPADVYLSVPPLLGTIPFHRLRVGAERMVAGAVLRYAVSVEMMLELLDRTTETRADGKAMSDLVKVLDPEDAAHITGNWRGWTQHRPRTRLEFVRTLSPDWRGAPGVVACYCHGYGDRAASGGLRLPRSEGGIAAAHLFDMAVTGVIGTPTDVVLGVCDAAGSARVSVGGEWFETAPVFLAAGASRVLASMHAVFADSPFICEVASAAAAGRDMAHVLRELQLAIVQSDRRDRTIMDASSLIVVGVPSTTP